jgi:hypothetical protein
MAIRKKATLATMHPISHIMKVPSYVYVLPSTHKQRKRTILFQPSRENPGAAERTRDRLPRMGGL